jgi:DNA-binding CsgD family transcriptional regulator
MTTLTMTGHLSQDSHNSQPHPIHFTSELQLQNYLQDERSGQGEGSFVIEPWKVGEPVPLVRTFISWLTFHPTTDEIARALATDYLSELSIQGIRFSRLQSDDSIIILGEYGFEDSAIWADRMIPSSEWRARDTEPARFLKGESKERWCNNSSTYMEILIDRGVTQGHLMVVFHKAVGEAEKNKVAETIQDLCVPLALYLSFLNHTPSFSAAVPFAANSNPREVEAGQLNQRQILILRGMVEGKTNHELATELGFSVSTIRHETMRIYQALSVSDRKEAAKKALALSII